LSSSPSSGAIYVDNSKLHVKQVRENSQWQVSFKLTLIWDGKFRPICGPSFHYKLKEEKGKDNQMPPKEF
jgi:hypothetical protein